MIRVTYLSQEALPLSSDSVLGLLTQCHRNNTDRGLTGMLLFGNGTFLQTLEGEAEVVDGLMEKISRDPRHTGMKVLRREAITERLYSQWSMGFERVTEKTLAEIPSLRNIGLRNFNPEYLSSHGEVIDTLLERHRAPHWDPLVRELDARDRLVADLRRGLQEARSRSEVAALVLESVVDAASERPLTAEHLRLCESALAALRQR